MDEPVDEERMRQIRISMEDIDTKDLLEIWRKNDPTEWAPETFEAIQQVLLSRGFQVPEQGENNLKEVEDVEQPIKADSFYDHKNFKRIAFYAKIMARVVVVILGLIVIAAAVILAQAIPASGDSLTSVLLLGVVLAFPVVLCGFFWVVLQGISEGIYFLLDIEANTRHIDIGKLKVKPRINR